MNRPRPGWMALALVAAALVAGTAACGGTSPPAAAAAAAPAKNEILWDSYGVPHVYGTSTAAVFYGYGYAQAQSHADEILRLYGEARGRGAEYWGAKYEDTAVWLVKNDVPARSKAWYDAQDPAFKANLDAFAKGMSDYGAAHPDAIDPEVRVVLPVTGVDVVAHAHRLMNFVYVASPNARRRRRRAARRPTQDGYVGEDGSNTWAISGKKTASGKTMLLQNPHLSWSLNYFTYYEAHLVAPDFEVYGATQIGLPIIRFAFNRQMGISNTVNAMVGSTTYKLTLKDGGYLFDGKVRPFETKTASYKVQAGRRHRRRQAARDQEHGPRAGLRARRRHGHGAARRRPRPPRHAAPVLRHGDGEELRDLHRGDEAAAGADLQHQLRRQGRQRRVHLQRHRAEAEVGRQRVLARAGAGRLVRLPVDRGPPLRGSAPGDQSAGRLHPEHQRPAVVPVVADARSRPATTRPTWRRRGRSRCARRTR